MKIKLIECPRDAMQGMTDFVATNDKVRYINALLNVGFDTIDFGSFVSPKAIPQLKDTHEVISKLDLSQTKSKLLSIVANERGAQDACDYGVIDYLGFPFSISEEFQKRNTNSDIASAMSRIEAIQNLCLKHGKTLVVYVSMAFGNPYGEHWHPDIAAKWSEELHHKLGVKIIALSDTIGSSNPENIDYLFKTLIPEFEGKVELGAHLHTTSTTWKEKVEAAHNAGCNRFDGALKGLGGCPMAGNDLVGNMPTENLLQYFNNVAINQEALNEAMLISSEIFA